MNISAKLHTAAAKKDMRQKRMRSVKIVKAKRKQIGVGILQNIFRQTVALFRHILHRLLALKLHIELFSFDPSFSMQYSAKLHYYFIIWLQILTKLSNLGCMKLCVGHVVIIVVQIGAHNDASCVYESY